MQRSSPVSGIYPSNCRPACVLAFVYCPSVTEKRSRPESGIYRSERSPASVPAFVRSPTVAEKRSRPETGFNVAMSDQRLS